MITASVSQTGSIREQNQDHVLIDAKLCLAILADGSGPQGLQAAEATAREIWKRISEVATVTSSRENEQRLQEAMEMAAQACSHFFKDNTDVSTAVIWLNRGSLVASANGRCAIATSAASWNLQQNAVLSIPVQPGQAILLCSEGIVAPLHSGKTETFNINLSETADQTKDYLQTGLESFISKVANAYDGDDRSAVLIFLEKSDLTAGEPHELELFEHYNREFSFPLWAPLAAAAGTAASGLYALYKLRKYLPRIIDIGRR